MIPFSEKYKTFDDIQLIRILVNADNYQNEAVKAATEEIKNRQLSQENIKELRDIIHRENQEILMKESQKKVKTNEIQNKVKQIVQRINPFTANIPWEIRFVRFVVIFLAIITIARWATEARFFTNVFSLGEFSLSYYGFVLFRILVLLVLPVIMVLFYKQKPFGWILALSYTLYRSVHLAIFTTLYIRTPEIIDSKSYIIMYLSLSIILLTISIILLHQKVRTIFNIKKTTGLLIAVFVFVMSFLSALPYIQS